MMRDLPSNIFAGCFMMAMAIIAPVVIIVALVSYAVKNIWSSNGPKT